MRMEVEVAAAPADEQPDREEDDQGRNRRLGAPLDELGQVGLEEQDREPKTTSVSAWPRPHQAPSAAARRRAVPARRRQRR